tara:strand:+ start:112 stop:348 length:237 start_codon:yes stop_codon:yes gene_type:complete
MKYLMLGLLICTSAFAITGDVSHDFEVERQLERAQDRQPQSVESHENFVGPHQPEQRDHFNDNHSKHIEEPGHQGHEQ